MRRSKVDVATDFIIYSTLFILTITTIYPFWHVVMYSISNVKEAMGGGLFFLPKGFSLTSYKVLFRSSNMYISFYNSVIRVVIGTVINIILTASLAYSLSYKKLHGRKVITSMIFFTMLFSGGMIPTFILVQRLGLYNTRWALILPGAISAYNMFIMKNNFQGIPSALKESAMIDGAGPTRTLFSIILPVSLPIIAAMSLFYGVGHWNSFFDGVLYIESQKMQVLQVFLKTMIQSSAYEQLAGIDNYSELSNVTQESMKMAAITISVIPVLMVYPFLQKFYIKGIMIGSIKG